MLNKNEIENLERIEKDEIKQDENFLTKKIEEHKTFLAKENKELYTPKHEMDISRLAQLVLEGKYGNGRPPKVKNNYQNETKIRIIFKEENSELNNEIRKPIIIKCPLFETTIKQLIEEYYMKIGNNSPEKKFIFGNKELIINDLTVWQLRMYDCCTIKVINA